MEILNWDKIFHLSLVLSTSVKTSVLEECAFLVISLGQIFTFIIWTVGNYLGKGFPNTTTS